MDEYCLFTPRTALFAVGGVCHVFVCLPGLLELPSGFKCTWYGLSHPVQFAVLILMPALLYGVNRLFDSLEKASHARLCPHATAASVEEREGGRPEHVKAQYINGSWTLALPREVHARLCPYVTTAWMEKLKGRSVEGT
ncbi:unnamed protein product [Ectocarpus sp. 12 AP-2014]